MKKALKQTLIDLITGKNEQDWLEIYHINSVTGKRVLYKKIPGSKKLTVIVDDPSTAESFLKIKDFDK